MTFVDYCKVTAKIGQKSPKKTQKKPNFDKLSLRTIMELPAGFEPTVSELQSLALPLGYGSSGRIITPRRVRNKGGITRFLLLCVHVEGEFDRRIGRRIVDGFGFRVFPIGEIDLARNCPLPDLLELFKSVFGEEDARFEI